MTRWNFSLLQIPLGWGLCRYALGLVEFMGFRWRYCLKDEKKSLAEKGKQVDGGKTFRQTARGGGGQIWRERGRVGGQLCFPIQEVDTANTFGKMR